MSGQTTISLSTYAELSVRVGRESVCIIVLESVGAMLSFCMFNHKPAQIFMGDLGSCALGGMLAVLSICLHREWSLLCIGIIYEL